MTKGLWLLALFLAVGYVATSSQPLFLALAVVLLLAFVATLFKLLTWVGRFAARHQGTPSGTYRAPSGPGFVKCRRCGGTGTIRCPGSGIHGGVSDSRRCPNCHGTNRVFCPGCAGKGLIVT